MSLNPRLFSCAPYSLRRSEKNKILLPALEALTKKHLRHCNPYSRILSILKNTQSANRIEKIPFLPVQLFKSHLLQSVPDRAIYKILTTSGTTSQIPAKIILDKKTSVNQSRALIHILGDFLGERRMPLLIIDSESTVNNPAKFSARTAGIMGLLPFSSDTCFVLNEKMELNTDKLFKFLEKCKSREILCFGFTYMVWVFFYEALRKLKKRADLSKATLLHSGGWKRLQEKAVSSRLFKKELAASFGLNRIHNFYGMAEQTGSIYMECEKGYLHASNFSEVLIRDFRDWSCLPDRQQGIIQTLSLLPESYPGHSLLTEDLGTIHGADNCLCGRRGTYFSVQGRIPQAEVRGCSDTQEN